MRLFRRRPKVIIIDCRFCGARMRVVKDSVPDRERLCNSCARRGARQARRAPNLIP